MDTFLTPNWITKDVAAFWDNKLRFVANMDRRWDESWRNKPEGAQIGDTVNVRIPQRFQVTEGQALQPQGILNQTVPLTIEHQQNVAMGWSSSQATLEVEDVQERYTMPAGLALANKVDKQAWSEVYKSVYYSIGTPGVAITSDETYTDGVALMQNVGIPEPYCAILDPKSQSKILNANFALFGPQYQQYFRTGEFAQKALGIDEWYVDPLAPTHTTGSFTTSTPIVTSAGQTGSSITTSGWGTYTFNEGDVFTIDKVYAINPIAFSDTNELLQFVVTSTITGSSTATITFSPPIIPSGQLQTVTNSPAANAPISYLGSTGTVAATLTATKSRQSMIMNGGAFAFVMVDMEANLAGARVEQVRSKKARLSMRMVEQYNVQTDQNPTRIDIMWGAAPILPYFAVRAWS